jgi:hypothetical protein
MNNSLYTCALIGTYFAAVCSILFFAYFGITPMYETPKVVCNSNRIHFGLYNEIDENSNIVWCGGMPLR